MKTTVLIALSFAMAGCPFSGAQRYLLPVEMPEGTAGLRCTKADLQVSGQWTGTSGQFETCQCLQFDRAVVQPMTIDMGGCSITTHPND